MAKPWPVHGVRATTPYQQAAQRIIRAKLAEMLSFHDQAIAGGNDEALHDMRIACKRLRESVALLRDGFAPKKARRALRAANRLNDALGPVRDADVFLEWLAAVDTTGWTRGGKQIIPALRELVAEEREAALRELQAAAAELLPKGRAPALAALLGAGAEGKGEVDDGSGDTSVGSEAQSSTGE